MSNESKLYRVRPRVVVAGASGFIGKALGEILADRYELIGLSRSARTPSKGYSEFRKVDLFSLRDSELALVGADFAIYLVHSMLPAARLVQGQFDDLDILCADNFARAAAKCGVNHVVYVGGLIPQIETLSSHLRSRLEVEHTLGARGIPVTTLRAGMVVGAEGSSYQLLARLVRRLPVMVCPSWTQSRMHPVALDDLVAAVGQALDDVPNENRVFDVGAPESVSYQELMAQTAASLGLKRRFWSVPLLSTRLSRLWVSLTTGAPKVLVAPLIESLKHDMLARDTPEFRLPLRATTTVPAMLAKAEANSRHADITPRAFKHTPRSKKESKVCSVQRMTLPSGGDAKWAVESYFRWLPKALKSLVRVEESDDGREIIFFLKFTGHRLLGLKKMDHRSNPQRQVLRVTAGLLANASARGRLEFRQVLDKDTLITSIQDFIPRLPWWIYRPTQGLCHRWVMWRFNRYLRKARLTPNEPHHALPLPEPHEEALS